MPQQMRRASTRAHHARTVQRPADDERDDPRREGAKRRTAADKHRIGLGVGSAILQVGDDGITYLPGQRQARGATGFATHVNPCAPPVDVAEPKLHDVARPKTQTGQQQQNRSIAPSHR